MLDAPRLPALGFPDVGGGGAMLHRIIALLAGIMLLAGAFGPARAATAIYYSGPGNAYGWCAGYAYQRAHSCAESQCQMPRSGC